MYEAVCNLNYFKVMKRAIRFISIEPLNLKRKFENIYEYENLQQFTFFFNRE